MSCYANVTHKQQQRTKDLESWNETGTENSKNILLLAYQLTNNISS